MIKKTLTILCCAFLAFGTAPFATAEENAEHAEKMEKPGVHAMEMYSYATATVQKNGAVFGTIHNATEDTVKITAAASDVAEKIELHTHLTENGVMKMREVEAYEIPAGEKFTLRPMSYHIMLMGLKEPLKEGQNFEVTLTKSNGETMPIRVSVVSPGMVSDDEAAEDHSHDDEKGEDESKDDHKDDHEAKEDGHEH